MIREIERPQGSFDFEGIFRAVHSRETIYLARESDDGNSIVTGTAFALFVGDSKRKSIRLAYMRASLIHIGECYKTECCIGDYNIGDNQNQNFNFIFSDEYHAKQYLGLK